MKSEIFFSVCICFALLMSACTEKTLTPSDEAMPDTCHYTVPKCSDDGTKLLSCYYGVEQSFDCAGGCVNGVCHSAGGNESAGCSYTVPKCSDDGSSVLTCLNGVEFSQACADGCENGVCRTSDEPDAECSYTVPKCSDDGSSVLTCLNGVESSQACADGCENGVCRTSDEPGAECSYTVPKCSDDGSSVLTCLNGAETSSACEYGCVNGACKELGACNYQESECSSDRRYLISCVDGAETAVECEHGCDAWGHKCYEPVEDDELGTACRLDADPYCKGDALIYCGETAQGNVWVKQDAPENFICGVYEEMSMLLEKCSKVGEEATLCSSSMQLARICTDVDGQLLYLPDYFSDETTFCYAGCNGNVCAEEELPATCDSSSFTERCTSEIGLYQCINGMIHERDCAGNSICIIDSNDEAVCGESCTPENAPVYECFDGVSEDGASIQIAVPVTCTKSPVSEKYGLERASTEQWMDCPGKCSVTKGCE